MVKIEISEDFNDWQSIFEGSPQKTWFASSELSNALDYRSNYFALLKNNKPILGFSVLSHNDFADHNFPLLYYHGLIFERNLFEHKNAYKTIDMIITDLGVGLKKLVGMCDSFCFCLHPSIKDVRAFDWLNYHDKALKRCRINVKYTAILDLNGITLQNYQNYCRSSRRQEYRYAIERENLGLCASSNVSDLFNLTSASFERQNIIISKAEFIYHKKFVNFFLEKKLGKTITISNKKNQKVVAGAFVFKDFDQTLHVPLVGIENSKFGGSLLYMKIIEYALSTNCKRIDFNGANSPKRAYFKHSMGALAKPYFEINY